MRTKRQQIINHLRESGYKGKILTPTEHKKLVKGKKVVFSPTAITVDKSAEKDVRDFFKEEIEEAKKHEREIIKRICKRKLFSSPSSEYAGGWNEALVSLIEEIDGAEL